MQTPEEILEKYWGFPHFRPAQKKVIDAVLQPKNVIALLPTGGGKSLCFQIPSLVQSGICIVISPLVALMQDQVQALQEKGIKAIMLEGKISYQELDQRLDNCIYGNYKFLYLSPERLQQDIVQQRIAQMNVNLIAVDEAHCISEWGHDFRPSYQKISILKELKPNAAILALTATATPRVLADIKESLQLEDAEVIKHSFERENISFLTKKCEDKNYELLQYLKRNPGVAIIYVRTRKTTLELKNLLQVNKISAEAYHGGISSEEKKKLLKNWQAENFKIMVATTAFGMGIDKANVRNIIHFHLPESLESFFQEAGRSGRDGEDANAMLIYNDADIIRLKNQFIKVLPQVNDVKKIYKKLNTYFSIAYGEGANTNYNFDFFDFCKTYSLNTQIAYNTLQLLDRAAIIIFSKEFHQRVSLQILYTNNQLYYFLEKNKIYNDVIKTLLRTQTGYFDYKSPVNLSTLSQKTGKSSEEIINAFQQLHQEKVIDFEFARYDTSVTFLVPREDDQSIFPIVPYIQQQYKNKVGKVESVLDYLENNLQCKTLQLLSYFGEEKKKPCGKCSVCLAKVTKSKKNKSDLNEIYTHILRLLREKNLDSRTLTEKINFPQEEILEVLRVMLDKKIISISNNTYSLNS